MDNLRTVTYKTYKAIYLFFHTFISRGLSRLQAFPSFLPPSPPRSCTRNRTETLATQAKARVAQRFWREMLGNLSQNFHGRKARRELHPI